MKKLAMLLMLFSLSVFNLGCEEGADEPIDEPAVDEGVGTEEPLEGEGEVEGVG